MDPNRALEMMRAALMNMDEPDDDASWFKDNSTNITELIQAAMDLDIWMSNGGFLPSDWNGKK